MNNMRIPKPMAHWDFSKYKDEDMTESVNYVEDLTGNGYDLRLNKFDFSTKSGFNGYVFDCRTVGRHQSAYVSIKSQSQEYCRGELISDINSWINIGVEHKSLPKFAIYTKGINSLILANYADNGYVYSQALNDGINIINEVNIDDYPDGNIWYITVPSVVSHAFEIRVFPLYPFSLVFNNTSAVSKIAASLPKESGFTLIANRKIIDKNIKTSLFGKELQGGISSYIIGDYLKPDVDNINFYQAPFSYGLSTEIENASKVQDGIIYFSRTLFNGNSIIVGKEQDNPNTPIQFGSYGIEVPDGDGVGYGHFAISEAWLFDRDLPQWQIEKFIRENTTPLPQVYYDVEKQGTTNQDTNKDKLIDFSGNGNHGQLANFTFDGSNGYAEDLEILNDIIKNDLNAGESTFVNNLITIKNNTNTGWIYQSPLSTYDNLEVPSFKVKVSGIQPGDVVSFKKLNSDNTNPSIINISSDGIYEVPGYTIENEAGKQRKLIVGITTIVTNREIKIEFLSESPKYLQFDASKETKVTLDTITKEFKTVFLEVDKGEEIDTILYDQRNFANNIPFAIYNNDSEEHIAYQARNINGVTYINGVLNNTIKCSELTSKHLITIVNDTTKETNFMTPLLGNGRFYAVYNSSMKLYKFLGFKEALSPEQIQKVIDRYNLNI